MSQAFEAGYFRENLYIGYTVIGLSCFAVPVTVRILRLNMHSGVRTSVLKFC